MSFNYNKNIDNLQQATFFSKNYIANQKLSSAVNARSQYKYPFSSNINTNVNNSFDNTMDAVAKWFLSMSTMSNKKLQKLCYYAYCWFIVLFNDIESIRESEFADIQTLWEEHFQAWIHGPVLPCLYNRYKKYGWHDIPMVTTKPNLPEDIEELLQEVWDAYAGFSADELEAISHEELPWKKARMNLGSGEACSNEISEFDILEYYSSLG